MQQIIFQRITKAHFIEGSWRVTRNKSTLPLLPSIMSVSTHSNLNFNQMRTYTSDNHADAYKSRKSYKIPCIIRAFFMKSNTGKQNHSIVEFISSRRGYQDSLWNVRLRTEYLFATKHRWRSWNSWEVKFGCWPSQNLRRYRVFSWFIDDASVKEEI